MLWNSFNFLKSPTFNQFKTKFFLPFPFSFFDSLKLDNFFFYIPELWSLFSSSDTQLFKTYLNYKREKLTPVQNLHKST